ncbi:MAG: hypothetical protein AAFR58_22300 [Cyanobacteria bacterium J06627_28]
MKASHLLSAAFMALGLSALGGPMAAIAFPEIASGDGIVNADINTCLARTDDFVTTLDVSIERGQMDRTGYFGDGSFRILCYPNPYGQDSQSLVVIFAAHESDFDVADTFVQIAVAEIAD